MNNILNIYRKLSLVILCVFTFSLFGLYAVSKNTNEYVHGIVKDENNVTLSGVVVSVKGEFLSTITDAKGKFSFSKPIAPKSKLVFALNGFYTKTILVNKKRNFHIVLKQDIVSRDQIIKLDNQTVTVNSITGAVATVSGDELRSTHMQDVRAALAGRLPGVYVKNTYNEPGKENYSINIRGRNTTNGEATKVIIDGVSGSLAGVNINDIENISVLRDATAKAIYGMDCPGGVIVVNTKRGHGGKAVINVRTEYSLQDYIKTPAIVNAGEYAALTNQALINDGATTLYSDDEIRHYFDQDSELYPNNDWYDTYAKPQVSTENINISARGGNAYANYYASIGYLHQGSPIESSDAEKQYGLHRFNIRTNFDLKINNFISAYVNIATKLTRDSYGRESSNKDIYKNIFNLYPYQDGPLTPDGHVIVTQNNQNSVYGMINKSGYSRELDHDLSTDIGINFDLSSIVDGMYAKVSGKYNNTGYSQKKGSRTYQKWIRDYTVTDKLEYYRYGETEDGVLSFSTDSYYNANDELKTNLGYEHQFKNHSFGAFAFMKYNYYFKGSSSDVLPVNRMTYGFNAHYSYNDTYFVNVLASYQGSEEFSKSKRYAFFPSISAGYVLSNSKLLKDNNTITYLKIRASYGVTGNDNFNSDSRFLYKNDFNTEGSKKWIQGYWGSIDEAKYGNSNLTYEKLASTDLGFDIAFWDELSFSVDYFYTKTTDILTEDNISQSISGIPDDAKAMINEGEMTNQGIEFMLRYNKTISKDLNFGASATFSFNKNKINEIGELQLSEDYKYRYRKTGYSYNQNWGYQIDYSNGNGYFNSEDEIANSGLTYEGKAPRVGDFIYKDQNGDNVISVKDVVPMGETKLPQIAWGVNLFANYKAFGLNVQLQGLGKYGSFNSGCGYYSSYNKGTFFKDDITAYTPERYAEGKEITGPALSISGSSSMKSNNYYYQDKSFFRLKNVELSYNLPRKLVDKMHLQAIRTYVSGFNLLTFDHMKSDNLDVEQGSVTNFPTARYYTVGFNVTF